MKKILAICLCIALFSSCKKDSGNSCATPSFTVNTSNQGDITVYTQNNYGFTVAEYGPNGFTRGSGTKATLGATGGTISGLANGTYDVYFQGNCGGSSNSDWTGPKSILVTGGTGACPAPSSLTGSTVSNTVYLTWSYSASTVFEVEYGPTGFTIGQGDTLLTNNAYANLGNVTYGTTYDFIVRAKCSDGTWGPWTNRFSYYINFNNNNCSAPTNVLTSVNGSNVDITWSPNGMLQWEYGLGTSSTPPASLTTGSSPSITITNTTTGYFYVRGICNGSNRTAWVIKSF